VRQLGAEALAGRIGVGVEVHETDRAVGSGAGSDLRFGDRVIPAEDNRDRARGEDRCDGCLDRTMRAQRIGRHVRTEKNVFAWGRKLPGQ
jgi:hypothetical protein